MGLGLKGPFVARGIGAVRVPRSQGPPGVRIHSGGGGGRRFNGEHYIKRQWEKLRNNTSSCDARLHSVSKGFHVGDARVKKLTPASKMCDRSGPII